MFIRFIKVAIGALCIIFIGGHGACANANDADWSDMDEAADSAGPAAEHIATGLATKLGSEHSRVVFLALTKCETGLADNALWCGRFQASLESQLIDRGVVFLAEASKDDVRARIAQEEVYQQNSSQVDLSKAVELGKQKAFQAFTSISVTASGASAIDIVASSINIREGVVSISEHAIVRMRRTRSRSIGVWLKSGFITSAGIAGTAYSLIQANKSNHKSDTYYTQYQQAQNGGDATTARQKVQSQDQITQDYDIAAGVCGLLALYGGYYFWRNATDGAAFQISTAGSHRVGSSNHRLLVQIDPIVSSHFVALGLTAHW